MPFDVHELKKVPSVKRWWGRMKGEDSVKLVRIYKLKGYLEWRRSKGLSTDPDAWIQECLDGTERVKLAHLDVLKEWVEGEWFDGDMRSSRERNYIDVRSFYLANRIQLPRERINPPRGDVSELPVRVTATDFLKMCDKVVNFAGVGVMVRSMIMCKLQGFMDNSTFANVFNYVAFPQLAKHFGTEDFIGWDPDRVPVRVDLVRTKSEYLHYTFLHHDAVMCLKDWLGARAAQTGTRIRIIANTSPNLMPRSEPIYITKYEKPITPDYVSMSFTEAGKQAGVNAPPAVMPAPHQGGQLRYPFHAHEVRDTGITLARRVGADVEAINFNAGHSIDADRYDKSPWDDPEYFAGQYSKVARLLNVISGKEAVVEERYNRKLESEVAQRDQKIYSLESSISTIQGQLDELLRKLPPA